MLSFKIKHLRTLLIDYKTQSSLDKVIIIVINLAISNFLNYNKVVLDIDVFLGILLQIVGRKVCVILYKCTVHIIRESKRESPFYLKKATA